MTISKLHLRQPWGKGWTFEMETPKNLTRIENLGAACRSGKRSVWGSKHRTFGIQLSSGT